MPAAPMAGFLERLILTFGKPNVNVESISSQRLKGTQLLCLAMSKPSGPAPRSFPDCLCPSPTHMHSPAAFMAMEPMGNSTRLMRKFYQEGQGKSSDGCSPLPCLQEAFVSLYSPLCLSGSDTKCESGCLVHKQVGESETGGLWGTKQRDCEKE